MQRLALLGIVGVALVAAVGGCQSAPKDVLTPPRVLTSPYDSSAGEVLWAVVPLRNESGTTTVDVLMVSDKLVAAAEEAEGIRCVPLNRTIEAIRALRMNGVNSPADARRLAQTMGVDGVLVGSVTAYDPYTPVMGLSVALFARPGGMAVTRAALTPRELGTSPTEGTPPPTRFGDNPLASASVHLDAKNNQVLMDVKSFGEGRLKGPSALGWRRYLASVEGYSEFCAYRTIDEVLRQEWVRVSRTAVASGEQGKDR